MAHAERNDSVITDMIEFIKTNKKKQLHDKTRIFFLLNNINKWQMMNWFH